MIAPFDEAFRVERIDDLLVQQGSAAQFAVQNWKHQTCQSQVELDNLDRGLKLCKWSHQGQIGTKVKNIFFRRFAEFATLSGLGLRVGNTLCQNFGA